MVELCLCQCCNSILQLLAQVIVGEAFHFIHLHNLSIFIVITTNNKFSLNRQFLRSKAESLLCNIETYTFYFKEDTTRCYWCNPSSGITLTLTHTHIGRLTSDWFIREDT